MSSSFGGSKRLRIFVTPVLLDFWIFWLNSAGCYGRETIRSLDKFEGNENLLFFYVIINELFAGLSGSEVLLKPPANAESQQGKQKCKILKSWMKKDWGGRLDVAFGKKGETSWSLWTSQGPRGNVESQDDRETVASNPNGE